MTAGVVKYSGPLIGSHFRAVARLALSARGSPASFEGAARQLSRAMSTGRDLRDHAIPEILSSSKQAERYHRLGDRAPWAWQRLPYALGFGVAFVAALHRNAFSEDDHRTAAPAAALSAAICIVDSAGKRGDDDPLVHDVACALFARCAELAAELTRDECVRERFVARIESLRGAGAYAGDGARVAALEDRSIAGALALADLVELTVAPDRRLPGDVWTAAERLGRIRCLADDLADLADDARRGRPNIVLARHSRRPRQLSDADMYRAIVTAASEIGRLLASSESGASERADDALGSVNALPELDALAVARLDWPVLPPASMGIPVVATALDSIRPQLQRAVDVLLEEAAAGFAHSAHHLRFPRGRQGATRHETHLATLLVRAVTLDALLDASAAGLAVPDDAIGHEAMALLLAKHPGVRGGWSYFDTVPELPPDADDLAQVLQELARVGGPELASACDEAVGLALGARRASGGFATWVLDPSTPRPLDRQMSAYISVIGGTGVHPEVVANLLGGLLLYAPARYETELQQGVSYLERRQNPGGWWESMWYGGRFYGTYKATAVLGRLKPGSEATLRAQAFLESSQHEDGGWGDTRSDPLSSAHALLACACVEGEGRCSRRGAEFLLSTQRDGGDWPEADWVQFPTPDGLQSYSSSVVTTGFALRALLATVSGPLASEATTVTGGHTRRIPAQVGGHTLRWI